MIKIHEKFMTQALQLARQAGSLGEVPVGALVVIDGHVVGQGYNTRELRTSCLEHAELNAIKDASMKLGRWRLTGAIVYSTLEPCIMCAGALVHARVEQVIFGAKDPKFGGIESLYCLGSDPRLNHRFMSTGGIMAAESAELLQGFFLKLRKL